jgi:hypothetical protein
MKAFLLKHKGSIIYWVVFLTTAFYFAPLQSHYYLENDIEHFRKTSLVSVSIWTGIALSILGIIFILKLTKSIRQSLLPSLILTVNIAFLIFLFQSLILAGALFINRQFKRADLQKNYGVGYLAGAPQTRRTFFPYDVSTREMATDNKLIDKLYRPGLKLSDTLTIEFDQGLFGIPFQPQHFK